MVAVPELEAVVEAVVVAVVVAVAVCAVTEGAGKRACVSRRAGQTNRGTVIMRGRDWTAPVAPRRSVQKMRNQ